MAQMATSIGLLLSVLCLASCGRDERQLRSLVGDGNLSVVEVGAGETTEIRLVQSADDAQKVLRITLAPANGLKVQRERITFQADRLPRAAPVIEGVDKVQLAPAEAANVRKRLGLFRPEKLSADGPFIMPNGCDFVFHGSSKAVVAYNRVDGSGGLFILQGNCDNRNASLLADELRDIVASLPKMKAAEAFRW